MKAIKLLTIPALPLILVTGACTRVEEKLPGYEEVEKAIEITVNCPTSAEDGTRTDIQGLNPVWKAGDELWLSDGVDAVGVTIPSEYDGQPYAKVSIIGLNPDSTFYALYPYQDSATVVKGTIYARIPTVQDGSFGKAHLAVGICKKDAERVIEFKNASAVLKFTTFREDLAMVQLHNTSVVFSGEFKINPETGAKSGNSNSLRKVTLPYKGSNIGEKYVSVMESNFPKGAKITFISRDGRMGYIYTSVKNALSNGYLYDLGDIDNAITMDETPAVNLGEEESANSYLITSGGSYRFPAVEGNSKNQIKDIAYGDVVWETTNKTSGPTKYSMASEVAYCDGFMYVRVPESAPDGNMLVSACDEYGNILWSWHLWLVREGVAEQTWPSGATMMDRNLGALSATPGNVLSNGLLYEWGRKDPFTGLVKYGASTAMAVTGTAITTLASNSDNGNVEYTLSHPTTYLWKNEGDWMAAPDPTLWSAALKTKYDPCPPGYHVPYETVFDGITADNAVYSNTNNGRLLTHESQQIWFPFAGRRQSGSGGINYGYSSAPLFYLYYDENTSTSGKCSWVGTTETLGLGDVNYQKAHSSGFSVRCQKIVTSGIVNTVKLKYNVTDVSYGVLAPSFTGEAYGARQIEWGDGASDGLGLTPNFYHYYNAPGTYSLTVTCVDASSITVPLGDLVEIDVTGF